MKERAPFPNSVKEQVRIEQQNRCAVCGSIGHLTYHHKIPQSIASEYGFTIQETKSKENAVGVCRKPCHDWLDYKALVERKFYPEVMTEMTQGVEYLVVPSMSRESHKKRGGRGKKH